MRTLPLSLVVLIAAVACRGSEPAATSRDTGGTLVISTAADADVLLPPLTITLQGAEITDQIFERLAQPDSTLNTIGDRGYQPELADRWTWAADSLSIAFHIRPDARWHDGAPVTARDVRFTFELYRNPQTASPSASLITDIDSVTVADTATAVFWFSRRFPEQFFEATYQMRILPEHLMRDIKPSELGASQFARHPIGSGPFRFARWDQGTAIELVADTTRTSGRARLNRVIWSVAPDYNTAVTRLLAGDADLLELLFAPQIAEVSKHPELKLVRYPSLQYGFLAFNLRDPEHPSRPHPLFGDRALRRALAMAVDRQSGVRNVFDTVGLVALGPQVRAILGADTVFAQIPYDPAAARAALDSLGWRDANGDGVRERAGRPLRFSIIVPSSSGVRRQWAVLLQDMMKQVGAQVSVEEMEFNTFVQRQQSGRFDAVLGAWILDPSESTIRQQWSAAASRMRGGVNYGSYESAAFDALVDSAAQQMDPERARPYWRRAYETLIADAPAVFLYEIVNVAGMHERIHPVGLRADAWWANLADWYIPAADRIPRDNLPLSASAQ
ncbi:MAG TPA: ABC transporter substrate-binding protein [Gemmatimonadaceae bacterium]|nr:ABC transporter substrate-binding protein [Gemmatimonadaceae bacterium]